MPKILDARLKEIVKNLIFFKAYLLMLFLGRDESSSKNGPSTSTEKSAVVDVDSTFYDLL